MNVRPGSSSGAAMRRPIVYTPIGTIHSPYHALEGVPHQPTAGRGVAGSIDIFPEYVDGLVDLEGFSYVVLLYHFHMSHGFSLRVTPFYDDRERGVFATRAPARPNGIGLSVVRLVKRDGATLVIEDVDIVDGTPLLDVKPYIPTVEEIVDDDEGS